MQTDLGFRGLTSIDIINLLVLSISANSLEFCRVPVHSRGLNKMVGKCSLESNLAFISSYKNTVITKLTISYTFFVVWFIILEYN